MFERDRLGLFPLFSAVVLIILSCVLSFLPSPWSYILLIPCISGSLMLGWALAVGDDGKDK